MQIPVPWAFIARVWTAIRQNPCTIEIIEESRDGGQWVRIRNDSPLPTQLFSVSFLWGLGGEQRSYATPLVWVLSKHTDQPLLPAHSFEHPVDAHEVGGTPEWCEVTVVHNRSKYPERKRFRPRLK